MVLCCVGGLQRLVSGHDRGNESAARQGNPKDQQNLTAITKRLFGNRIERSAGREMRKRGTDASLPYRAYHLLSSRCFSRDDRPCGEGQGRLALGTAASAEPGIVAVK